MSRYVIPSNNEDLEVVVGWDPPLNTYFVQVYDRSIEDEDKQLVLWEMGVPDPLRDIIELYNVVAPYTPFPRIPEDIRHKLSADAST